MPLAIDIDSYVIYAWPCCTCVCFSPLYLLRPGLAAFAPIARLDRLYAWLCCPAFARFSPASELKPGRAAVVAAAFQLVFLSVVVQGSQAGNWASRYHRFVFKHNMYKLREERDMKPATFSQMVSATLYEKRCVAATRNIWGTDNKMPRLE